MSRRTVIELLLAGQHASDVRIVLSAGNIEDDRKTKVVVK